MCFTVPPVWVADAAAPPLPRTTFRVNASRAHWAYRVKVLPLPPAAVYQLLTVAAVMLAFAAYPSPLPSALVFQPVNFQPVLAGVLPGMVYVLSYA